MLEENVEIVGRGMDAWNRADLDEWLFRLRPGSGVAYHRPFRGSGCVSRT